MIRKTVKDLTNQELARAIGGAVSMFAFNPESQDGVLRGSIDWFGALLAERDRRADESS